MNLNGRNWRVSRNLVANITHSFDTLNEYTNIKLERNDREIGKRRRVKDSVTRLGDLLDFGYVFKAFGNN